MAPSHRGNYMPLGNMGREDDDLRITMPTDRGSGSPLTLGLIPRIFRRRSPLTGLLLLLVVVATSMTWGPVILGEERMQAMGIDKWREALPMAWSPPPPPPPPMPATGAGAPLGSGFGGKFGGGGPPAPPGLPSSHEDNVSPFGHPVSYDAESRKLDGTAFPPLLYTYPGAEIATAAEMYPDGNPHAGVIPPHLLNILQGEIKLTPPSEPPHAPDTPAWAWTSHAGWSRAVNGSSAKASDAMTPAAQPVEPDWRPEPFQGWQPPLEELSKAPADELPRVQHAFEDPSRRSGKRGDEERERVLAERQRLVRNAFLHAWQGYKTNAWGHDEVKPKSGMAQDNFNGWGATIVDALDTLLVMDLPGEYDLARQHVNDIDFHLVGGDRSAYGSNDGRIPVFETVIRYLGGFLSAYDLSGDELMRDRAEELAQLILPAFETHTGVPLGRIRFGSVSRGPASGVILAEAGSLLLEMTKLWQATGNRTYFDRVQRATDWLDFNMTTMSGRLDALLPTTIYPESKSGYGWVTFGGMSDSFYEYLIKEHQLLGGRLSQYGRMFDAAMDSARKWIIRDVDVVPGANLLVVGQSNGNTFSPKLEHLACFSGGMLALGSRLRHREHDLQLGRRFAETCWWAYNATATGIGPEDLTFYRESDTDRYEVRYEKDGTSRRGPARGSPIVGVRRMGSDYRNRPETIESVWYLWRITGDPVWQDRGWQMFSSWVTHCMTDYGFSGIQDVQQVPVTHTDSMESFVFAETFKYYYLLFSPPDLISLDDYVLTTEAHPFLLPKNGKWPTPGKGPRKFWTPPANPAPPSTGYAGGRGGAVGALTAAQRLAVYERWQRQEKLQKTIGDNLGLRWAGDAAAAATQAVVNRGLDGAHTLRDVIQGLLTDVRNAASRPGKEPALGASAKAQAALLAAASGGDTDEAGMAWGQGTSLPSQATDRLKKLVANELGVGDDQVDITLETARRQSS